MSTVLVGAILSAKPHLSVLWVGNSLTYVHDLPGLVTALGASEKSAATFSSKESTTGGMSLQQHTDPQQSDTMAQIAKGGNDFVVLQDQSQECAHAVHRTAPAPARIHVPRAPSTHHRYFMLGPDGAPPLPRTHRRRG